MEISGLAFAVASLVATDGHPSAMMTAATGMPRWQQAQAAIEYADFGEAVVAGQLVGAVQAGAADSADLSESGDRVEEIIVTAQRRTENVQRVPITVTAVSGTALTSFGISDSQAIQTAVPGLIINRAQQNTSPIIRGVGTNSGQPGLEQPVAIYVDGVYQPIAPANTFNLTSVERIEVLKGPQGTLFGRNATGGVLSITTRKPSMRARLDAHVGYGTFDTWMGDLYATTGLASNISADIAYAGSRQGDGWGRNITTGEEARRDIYSDIVRTNLLWEAGDRTELTFTGQYSRIKSSVSAFVPLPGATSFQQFIPSPPGFYDAIGSNQYMSSSGYMGSLKLVHDFGGVVLTDIAAYQDAKTALYVDVDGIDQPDYETFYEGRQKVLTNELQLASPSDSRLTWLTGLFYMHQDSKISPLGQANYLPVSLTDRNVYTTKSIAPFAQATYSITDTTRLTGGIRYTQDQMHIVGNEVDALGTVRYETDQRATQSKFTFRAAIEQDLSPQVMAFGSFNRGFRAGIFNAQLATRPVLKPEVIDAFEVGLKSTMFDRRLVLNVAVFHYKYSNIILRSFDRAALRSVLTNAAGAEMTGANVDFQAALGGWRLNGGFEILDAVYNDFPDALLSTRLPNGNNTFQVGDASRNRMLQSPKFSGQLGIQRTFALNAGDISLGANFKYTSSTYFDPDNRFRQGPVGLLGASIQWTSSDKRWDVRLWGLNLTDRRYYQGYNNSPTDNAVPAAPRTFGVKLGIHL